MANLLTNFYDGASLQLIQQGAVTIAKANKLPISLPNAGEFKDANGILQPRNLTTLDPNIFRSIPNTAVFMQSGIKVSNIGGYGETIRKIGITHQGNFTESRNGTSKGLIGISGSQDDIKVIQKEAQMGYSFVEMQQAKLGNYSIVDENMRAVNRVYMEEIDEILATGTSQNEGLLNYSGFTASAAGALVSTFTGQQNFDAIKGLIEDQWNSVNNNDGYKANNVMFPSRVYNYLSSQPYLPNAGTKSVLNALRESYPSVRFGQSWRNESVSGTSVTVAYCSADNCMQNRIPVPLMISKTDESGFNYKADMFYRIAGLDVVEDLAGRILTGL